MAMAALERGLECLLWRRTRSDGWQRQQGDPGGQPGQGPGGPHHRRTASKIVNLTLATSETWNDRQSGERKERTEWHRVVIFNDRVADVAERFLNKGRKIYVEGSLQTRKWTDQSGQETLHDRGGDRPLQRRADACWTARGGGEGAAAGEGGGYRERAPAQRVGGGAAAARGGGPSWDAPEGRRSGRRNPVLSNSPAAATHCNRSIPVDRRGCEAGELAVQWSPGTPPRGR